MHRQRQNLFTLSYTGETLAQAPPIKEAVRSVRESEEYDPWVQVLDYESDPEIERIAKHSLEAVLYSNAFKALTPEEQYHVQALGALEGNWRKLGGYDPNALLPETSMILGEIEGLAYDKLLLGGATLLDLHRERAQEILEQYQIYGFQNKLHFANFIGAAIVAERSNESVSADSFGFTISEDAFTARRISVGANFHGDFIMRQHTKHTGEWIDPTGSVQQFGPMNEPLELRGYHSVEPSLVIAALKHLDSVLDQDEQKTIVEKTVQQYQIFAQDKTRPTSTLFADHGGDSEELEIDMMKMHFQASPGQTHTDEVWANLPIDPVSEQSLRVETRDGHLTLGNTSNNSNDSTRAKQNIVLPSSQVGEFILSLLKQSYTATGRTSDSQILNVLHARYQMLTGSK